MSNEVGLRLKEIRWKLQITQEQFGEKLGIKGSTMAKHENGFCFPTGKMLNILASKYNVSMDYLLCGRGTLYYKDRDSRDSSHIKDIIGEDKEMEELFSLMSSVPLVRYSILSYFQRFKLENNELIDKVLGKNTG